MRGFQNESWTQVSSTFENQLIGLTFEFIQLYIESCLNFNFREGQKGGAMNSQTTTDVPSLTTARHLRRDARTALNPTKFTLPSSPVILT